MLVGLILNVLVQILQGILFFLPQVSSLNIMIGSFSLPIDTYLSEGMGWLSWIMQDFPPLLIMYYGFLWVIGWKATLLLLNVFKVFRHRNA